MILAVVTTLAAGAWLGRVLRRDGRLLSGGPARPSLAVLAFVALASGCGLTRGAVYFPEPDRGRPPPEAVSEKELAVRDLTFAAADGTKLHGWLAPYSGARRAILYCHGNGGNLEQEEDVLLTLREVTKAHVLVFDYRGYGSSEGSPEEEGIALDAQAALAALGRETGVAVDLTCVLGHSLGGAVAVELATRTAGLSGLVVLSSFTSIDDVARHHAFRGLGLLCPESYDSLAKIGALRCRKLFLHGDLDEVIPYDQGVRLFEAAAPPKRFVRLVGWGHQTTLSRKVFWEVARFLEE